MEPIKGFNQKCFYNRKIQYESEIEAHKAAKKLRKRKGPRTKPYICRHCHMWHIGHWRKPEFRQDSEEYLKKRGVI